MHSSLVCVRARACACVRSCVRSCEFLCVFVPAFVCLCLCASTSIRSAFGLALVVSCSAVIVKSPKERRLWSAIHTICGPPHAMPSQVDEKRSKAKGASAPNRRFIVIEGVYANSGTAPTAAIDGECMAHVA